MKEKIRLLLTYSRKSIRFIWRNDRQYYLLTAISIVLGAIRVFPGMFLMSYSIDLLARQAPPSDYLNVVLSIILIMPAPICQKASGSENQAERRRGLSAGRLCRPAK